MLVEQNSSLKDQAEHLLSKIQAIQENNILIPLNKSVHAGDSSFVA
jgi:hypothetical protein